jgi:hypothetical protein
VDLDDNVEGSRLGRPAEPRQTRISTYTQSRFKSGTKGSSGVRYRVNSPQVIAETLGDETINVNLATGHYFNLQQTAVEVWEALARQEPVSTIVPKLQGRYDAADGEIENAVARLISDFQAAELIVPEEDDGAPVEAPVVPTVGERQPFVAPTFATFTDMQDIILLDPVHEVDARGWPHAPAGS